MGGEWEEGDARALRYETWKHSRGTRACPSGKRRETTHQNNVHVWCLDVNVTQCDSMFRYDLLTASLMSFLQDVTREMSKPLLKVPLRRRVTICYESGLTVAQVMRVPVSKLRDKLRSPRRSENSTGTVPLNRQSGGRSSSDTKNTWRSRRTSGYPSCATENNLHRRRCSTDDPSMSHVFTPSAELLEGDRLC